MKPDRERDRFLNWKPYTWERGDGNPENQIFRAVHGLNLAMQKEGHERLEWIWFAVDMIVTAAVERMQQEQEKVEKR